jgi:MoxR-like ATPase
MLTEWPVVGRVAVLSRLLAALDSGRTRRPVVLHGAAGVGKSRLLSEALGRLTDRGTPVVHIVGSPVDAEIPFWRSRASVAG